MPCEPITVPLPSLLHRLERQKVDLAKQLCEAQSCQLKRVRRSRNWQLVGSPMAIDAFVRQYQVQAKTEVDFLINKVQAILNQHQDKLEPLEDKLQRMLQEQPNMTLAELMQATQCSLMQARQARLSLEETW
ncbi:ribosome recycling factor family protein [Vibrio sp. WXL103]|uniref:ribosome recycling factor family protein n=1 Tax=unclassified Vibrio TaxID=2614977 RepID=UPI003EC835BD